MTKKEVDKKAFWENTSKIGRKKIFSDHNVLWAESVKYFKWCDDNPFIETDFKGKDADRVHIPRMRPYTLQGLCLFLGVNTAYFRQFNTKTLDNPEEFSTVITRINEIIYDQKFSAAASGFLNANIISRDLGLQEKTHVSIDEQKKETGDLFPFDEKGNEKTD